VAGPAPPGALTGPEPTYGGVVTPVRLAYLGTPELAVPPLRALVDAGHDVALVVTRPDRRRGRGPSVAPSPVKRAAEDLGLAVADDLGALEELARTAGVELGVVVAYGRLVPARLLEQVPMLNLHFSLLPRWRGAAPVERAILAGDTTTGVCVMGVEEGLDTGPVYAAESLAIGPGEHLAHLRSRLVAAGSRLIVGTLAGGVGGLPRPEPQAGEATYADKLTPADLELQWTRPAELLARAVRLDRAWTTFRGHRLGVAEADVVTVPEVIALGAAAPAGRGPDPGTLHGDTVVTGEGALRLVVVQPEGRRPMDARAWVRGARPAPGERLGG